MAFFAAIWWTWEP